MSSLKFNVRYESITSSPHFSLIAPLSLQVIAVRRQLADYVFMVGCLFCLRVLGSTGCFSSVVNVVASSVRSSRFGCRALHLGRCCLGFDHSVSWLLRPVACLGTSAYHFGDVED